MYGSNGSNIIGFLLIGGPGFVFSGLRSLNEKRLIENMPRSKVRSAAMGLVEMYGIAIAKSPQIAPISGLPCCWWHYRVEELRSSGRDSHWQMTAERASATPFYLQDETGRIVVDPTGAEFHVTTTTRDGTSDLLTSLGIASAASWLGGNRTRVIEQLITDQAPLLVVGERVSLAESPLQRQERLRAYIESVKKDPAKMAAADLDGDGILNADEWDAFRRRLESEFTQADLQRSAQTPTEDQVMIRAPVGGKFVISTQSADALEKSLQWQVPMSIAGGIAASALGVWLAIINHWSAFLILGLIAVSFVASLFVKGEDLWSWFSW